MEKTFKTIVFFAFVILLLKADSLKTHFQGPWHLNDEALEHYKLVTEEDFGIFKVELDENNVLRIPDNLYPVRNAANYNSSLGIRAVPVQDPKDNLEGDSRYLDKLLKYFLYGSEDTDKNIFAIIAYTHPEINSGKFENLERAIRSENGITHLGAYIGNGETRNAPPKYHNQKWELKKPDKPGYPAHVYLMSLKGVKQEALILNTLITLRLLNETREGPEFPEDYKFDHMRTYNLEEVLAFYRGWLDTTYVRTDLNKRLIEHEVEGVEEDTPFHTLLKNIEGFKTYCAEHIAIVINASLNIVHTEAMYKEIWGDEVGTALFKIANDEWKKLTGSDIPQDYLAKEFKKPLWKRRLKDAGAPLVDHPKIKCAKSFCPNTVGVSLAWTPETTADVMADFISQYANFTKVQIPRSIAAMYNFYVEVKMRMGLTPEQYFPLANNFIERMLTHDIRRLSAKHQLYKTPYDSKLRSEAIKMYFQTISQPLGKILNRAVKFNGERTKGFEILKPVFDTMRDDLLKLVAKNEKSIIDFPSVLDLRKFDEIYKNRKTLKALDIKLPKDLSTLNEDDIAWINFVIDIHKRNLKAKDENGHFVRFVKGREIILDETGNPIKKNGSMVYKDDGSLVEQGLKASYRKVSLMQIAKEVKVKTVYESQLGYYSMEKYVQFYFPPALMHRIVSGLRSDKVDKDFKLYAVATAFDKSELRYDQAYEMSEDDNKKFIRKQISIDEKK